MKKIIMLFPILYLALASKAQTVNNIPLKDIDVEFVQIVGTRKALSNQIIINIDFGQRNVSFYNKDTQLRDENNQLVTFNSMMDALNFMYKNGYDFVTAYAVSSEGTHVHHCILRKKKNE